VPRKQQVLLVEDRDADVRLTTRAILKAGYDVDIEVATNGQEALDRLQRVEGHKGKSLPDLVLLDWMMPLVNGEEVLEAVRQDAVLRGIPIVVLTTSNIESDVQKAYQNGCNAYLVKPVDPSAFQDIIDALGLFWLKHAVLPPRAG
jgi:CheY-like chemotaxis protein